MRILWFTLLLAPAAWSLECAPTQDRYALAIGQTRIEDPDWALRLMDGAGPRALLPLSVAGDDSVFRTLDNGWVFALVKQRYGWHLKLFDRPEAEGGIDLSQVTPPLRGPNARDIAGWHFRSKDNGRPNTGEVNAPQHLRLFEFSTALIGSGGFKSSGGSLTGDGRGWLKIHDMGLADLGPGQRARMNYLSYSACLTWPRLNADPELDPALEFLPEELEIMGRCGLDLDANRMSALAAPRMLGADFDGDGSLDDVAPVAHRASGRRDLALCLAGTELRFLSTAGDVPVSSYERWQVVPRDFARPGEPGGQTVWPDADGDVLVLERLEKSLHLVYFVHGELQSRVVFRHSEP